MPDSTGSLSGFTTTRSDRPVLAAWVAFVISRSALHAVRYNGSKKWASWLAAMLWELACSGSLVRNRSYARRWPEVYVFLVEWAWKYDGESVPTLALAPGGATSMEMDGDATGSVLNA